MKPGIGTNRLDALDPVVMEKALLFIERCRQVGIIVVIESTYRDQAREDYLSGKKGFHSDHTNHTAFDFSFEGQRFGTINGEANIVDRPIFKRCGEIAKSCKLRWGGDFNKPDHVHCDNRFDKSVKTVEPTVATSVVPPIRGTISTENIVTQVQNADAVRTQNFNEQYSVLENFTIDKAGVAISALHDSVKGIKYNSVDGVMYNKFIKRIIKGRPAAAALPQMVRIQS